LGLAIAIGVSVCDFAVAQPASLVTLQTPRGVKQRYLLITPPQPKAAVVLFAGGHGALGLKSATDMTWGKGNFLVRSRELFAAQGLMVAVMDAPSDHPASMSAEFRMSAAHAQDIAAVAADLKRRAPGPVWLVGTSMGTFSAARGAMAAAGIDGLALTSTVTRAKPHWKIKNSHPDGVASMALAQVSAPTLILFHAKDACDITPAADAPKLKRALSRAKVADIVLLTGGLPPQSDPCEAKSEHGFLGIEAKAVDTIVDFIRRH
jgi:pimeloyl-ACP methyl ester carboxylesterase